VLILGQTPPPFHGQSLMIRSLLGRPMPGVERRHVRLAYSREMEEIGKVAPGKVLHLFGVIARTWFEIARFRPDVVFYPPSGPNLVPATRDLFTLLAIRPFCRKLVLQFHAGGISELLDRKWPVPLLRTLFGRAFRRPDGAIMLGPSAPPDGQRFEAKRLYFVPNGIEDPAAERLTGAKDSLPVVLFVGVLLESKGVVVLARAAEELWRLGRRFRLVYVGRSARETDAAIHQATRGFDDSVELTGVLTGREKWERFAGAALFCYPTHFNSEVMPVACLEAMAFGLPVVATRWRAIPDVVQDGTTGFLVSPPASPEALAGKLDLLLSDPDLARRMGTAGRKRFEEEFTEDACIDRMRRVFVEVGRAPRGGGDGGA